MEKKKMYFNKLLSIFLACVMLMNIPMSALAFEDVPILEVVDELEIAAAEEDLLSSDPVIADDEIAMEELIIDSEEITLDSSSDESVQDEETARCPFLNFLISLSCFSR